MEYSSESAKSLSGCHFSIPEAQCVSSRLSAVNRLNPFPKTR